jgi:hypothetical protein
MRGGCALAQKRYLQLSLSNASVLSLNRRCVELAKRRVQIAIASAFFLQKASALT